MFPEILRVISFIVNNIRAISWLLGTDFIYPLHIILLTHEKFVLLGTNEVNYYSRCIPQASFLARYAILMLTFTFLSLALAFYIEGG